MKKFILTLLIILIFIMISSIVIQANPIDVKDYIKDKFPSIFSFYLSSLEDLDPYEKKFIDLLEKLPKEEQEYYAKEVYKNGFSLELLKNVKEGKTIQVPTSNSVLPSLPKADDGVSTFYVSPNGKDSNPGTEAKPWKTLTKAAETARAGDTVYIMSGTYKERLVPKNSGEDGRPIRFYAAPNNEVIIDGTDSPGLEEFHWGGVVDIIGHHHIEVSGIRVINSPAAGIFIEHSSSIRIENNSTYDTFSSGIGVWRCSDVVIKGNSVEYACNGGYNECIRIMGTDMFEVCNNIVFNGGPAADGGEGIDACDGSRNGTIHNNELYNLNRVGVYVDAWDKHTYNIEVFENVSHDNKSGIGVASENGGLLENIFVHDNRVYNNEDNGFFCSGWGLGDTHPLKNIRFWRNISHDNGVGFYVCAQSGATLDQVEIVNNVIYNSYTRGMAIYGEEQPALPILIQNIRIINNTIHNSNTIGIDGWGGGVHVVRLEELGESQIVFRNNIISDSNYFSLVIDPNVPSSGLIIEHNLISDFFGKIGETVGDQAVTDAPTFFDPENGDFRLVFGSAGIDQGSSVDAPTDDFLGNPRPYGDGFDIGAFEFVM